MPRLALLLAAAHLLGCDFKECEPGVQDWCVLEDPDCIISVRTCKNDGHWSSCRCVLGSDVCFAGDRRSCEEHELPEGCCDGFVECTPESTWDECTCREWCDATTLPDAAGEPLDDPTDPPADGDPDVEEESPPDAGDDG